ARAAPDGAMRRDRERAEPRGGRAAGDAPGGGPARRRSDARGVQGPGDLRAARRRVAGAAGMRPDAVVFDLFGTLVPAFSRSDFYGAVRTAAEILGCDPEAFERGWVRTGALRQTGAYAGGMAENVRAIVAELGGGEPGGAGVIAALATRTALCVRSFSRWP